MASLIKCRKCGGPHVTLKCGKEAQDLNKVLENKFAPNYSGTNHFGTKVFEKNENKYNKYDNKYENIKIDKRKIVVIKISNLPQDITVPELNELVSEWGKIGRINISTYDNTTCYIDFYFKDEAIYFMKAIDKTPFDNLILNVELIEKDN